MNPANEEEADLAAAHALGIDLDNLDEAAIAEMEDQAIKGDPKALEAIKSFAKDRETLEKKSDRLGGEATHKVPKSHVGGLSKGILNRLDRAIERVQAETGNVMSPALAAHYRQAVVKRKRRKKDQMAKRSRKRNRR